MRGESPSAGHTTTIPLLGIAFWETFNYINGIAFNNNLTANEHLDHLYSEMIEKLNHMI